MAVVKQWSRRVPVPSGVHVVFGHPFEHWGGTHS